MLAQREAFDRGYYAGPFGWVSAGGAEFAVAIRSALVHPPPPAGASQQQGAVAAGAEAAAGWNGAPQLADREALRRISLFAGVGIVDGSRPDSEWAELQLKVKATANLGSLMNMENHLPRSARCAKLPE